MLLIAKDAQYNYWLSPEKRVYRSLLPPLGQEEDVIPVNKAWFLDYTYFMREANKGAFQDFHWVENRPEGVWRAPAQTHLSK